MADKQDYLFAATPPIEALRSVLAFAAVKPKEGNNHDASKVDFNDINRAYFHALATRDIYI